MAGQDQKDSSLSFIDIATKMQKNYVAEGYNVTN